MTSASLASVGTFLLWALSVSAAQTKQSQITLVGIWQDSPEIASGWSDTYQLFADGNFVFHHNQMDCKKREVSYAGQWKVQGNSLKLSVTQRTLLVGGHFEQARGSCGTEIELKGAQQKTYEVKPSQLITLTISEVRLASAKVYNFETAQDEMRSIPHVSIGGTDYWKLRDNPADF
jgi:hypothetical protein